jgi:hypothetical protein
MNQSPAFGPRAAVIVARPDDETLWCGGYILAGRKLLALTDLVKPWHENRVEWGFNDWIDAQTGQPARTDWQTSSAAMYLYPPGVYSCKACHSLARCARAIRQSSAACAGST